MENFGILTPGDPNFDLSQKNDRNDFEMISRELSNAAFRFSLRRPGAEIMGGGRSNAPPPPAGGGKSRGPAGRGLSDVTSKRNLATLTPCHSHSYEPSVFKLLEVDEVNSSSNLYILDFLYSWPEVRSISWPAHVKSMGKISTTSFSHQNISIHWEWCWLRSSVMTQATVFIGDPPKVIWGHLRSPTVFCE